MLNLGNNLQVNRDYYAWETPNGQGRLQSLQAGTASNPTSLQNLSYTYDAVGNVATLTDAGETTNFTYDALDRLTGVSGPYSQSYEYSGSDGKIGNLTFKTGVGSYTYSASVSGCSAGTQATKPHAVAQAGSDSFGYDCNGNMTGRADDSLTYDAENRLQSVTSGGETVTFTYDGDGRRVLRDTVTDTVAYIGPHYEARYTKTGKPEDLDDDCRITVIDIMQVAANWGQAGGPEDVNGSGIVDVADVQQVAGQWRETCHVLAGATKYYSLGGRRVAMRKAGTLYYLFTDHLGSTSVTYNTATSQTQTLHYYPWGSIRSGDVPTGRRFTGQRWDSTIDLYDYQARWYDPLLGRFVQPDTIVPNPGNPQDLNRYGYTRNNPLRYTDPTGHCVTPMGVPIPGCVETMTQVAQQAQALVVQCGPQAIQFLQAYGDKLPALWDRTVQFAREAGNRLQGSSQGGNTADPGGLDPNDPRFHRLLEALKDRTKLVSAEQRLNPTDWQEAQKLIGELLNEPLNTTKFEVEGYGYRVVPDFVNLQRGFIADAKFYTDKLYLKPQVRAMIDLAKQKEVRLYIYTSVDIEIQPELIKLIEETGGGVIRIFNLP